MKFEASVVIDRPVEEVFAYMKEIKNWLQWNAGMLEAEQSSEGSIGVGTTYRGVSQSMGQRMEWTSEVTAYEPDKKVVQRLHSGPMLFDQIFAFEPVEGGIKLTLGGEGETGGFFKLAEPILKRRMQKEMDGNLSTFKGILAAR